MKSLTQDMTTSPRDMSHAKDVVGALERTIASDSEIQST